MSRTETKIAASRVFALLLSCGGDKSREVGFRGLGCRVVRGSLFSQGVVGKGLWAWFETMMMSRVPRDQCPKLRVYGVEFLGRVVQALGHHLGKDDRSN